MHAQRCEFSRQVQIELNHVPCKGCGPAISDLLGGHIQVAMATLVTMLPFHKAGILAIGEKQRVAQSPEPPTIAETIPNFEATSWLAFYAPGGTPKSIVETLNRELVLALKSEDVSKKLADAGLPVIADSSESPG